MLVDSFFAKCGAIRPVFSLLLLALTSCASVPVVQEQRPEWSQLGQVEAWVMKGRIAFRQNQEGWHGMIGWFHDQSLDEIKIAGPVGQGAFIIRSKGGAVEIQYADGRVEMAEKPDELIKKQLGFSIPLQAMRWWVLGLPIKGKPFRVIEDSPDSVSFRQDDWTVSQRDFHLFDGRIIPRRLKIENTNLSLKLVVDRWKEVVAR